MGLRQEAEAAVSTFEYIRTTVQRECGRPLLAKLVAGFLTPPAYLIARLVVHVEPKDIARIYTKL